MKEYEGKFQAYEGKFQADEDEFRGIMFSELKHHSLELLDLIQNPKKKSSSLLQFLELLRRSPPGALQPFLDYALFPVLLLLDAAVNSRSATKVDSEELFAMFNVPKAPNKVSDAIAEGVINCLEELLKKCHLGSIDQMVLMLKKLTYAAMLPPSEASEEFREGVIRCLRALLFSLHLCSKDDCLCKQINEFPAPLMSNEVPCQVSRISDYDSEPKECLVAFLQSQEASAAIGHWLSILLKAADTEVARGHRGSAKLRVEAFMALRMLVFKVGAPDALAFFLPGVVSQLGKALNISKTMSSGAAGSAEATDQAIRGLAEFLVIVLDDEVNSSCLDVNEVTECHLNKEKSSLSFLEELRELPLKAKDQSKIVHKDSSEQNSHFVSQKNHCDRPGSMISSLRVKRTKEWILESSSHAHKLLVATFPHLCVHPIVKVRQGILAAIEGLLLRCCYTMAQSRAVLLECLCVLACDDCKEVCLEAQTFLGRLLSSEKHHVKRDITEMFGRLVEKLPKEIFGNDESSSLLHAQKLLVIIYFSGPHLVTRYLLQSSVTAAKFLDVLALSLSQNSLFSGSLNKLTLAKSSSSGYLHSLAEIRNDTFFIHGHSTKEYNSDGSEFSSVANRRLYHVENMQQKYELPRMPPWFSYVGSQKLYKALARILRLIGLSLFSDSQGEGSLSVVADVPLGYLRKLVSDIQKREYNNESWLTWYQRTGSGQLVQQCCTAVCILNEMLYGVTDMAVEDITRTFPQTAWKGEMYEGGCHDVAGCELSHAVQDDSSWQNCLERGLRSRLIDCVGNILHEYLSSEVWDLPLEQNSSILQSQNEFENIALHFFQDNAMLHQVIIDGIGILNLCLGSAFSSCGFLHSSLYLLLENLICSNFQIRSASDSALRVMSAASSYPSVRHLILANADYIIDSICQQLRHLSVNPHVPNVLAAMLSYIGVAHKVLPLLEEPMRFASLGLEILGRNQHPDLTIAFLKAVAEIAKTCKREAQSLPNQAETYLGHVKSEMCTVEKGTREKFQRFRLQTDGVSNDFVQADADRINMQIEQWESILFSLNDSKRYRQAVGSIASSCVTAATPLLASATQTASLLSLEIVEDGIVALAKVEEAYKKEGETKVTIEKALQLYSLHHLQDARDAAEDETVENRLLPAANKIWPFLVACVQNKNSLAVRRCLDVIRNIVQICGGDFFSRRFHTDGIHFWRLLSSSSFQKRIASKDEKATLILPYRCTSVSSEESVAEDSNLKVQAAVLNMIAHLSRDRRSASALDAVLKKVSGLVVGIACSGVAKLQEASLSALTGLASIDPDLIWLLLADVYYSLKQKDIPSPPNSCFPEIYQLLPPPSSSKGYLYVQYGGQSFGFEIDPSAVEAVVKIMHSQVFHSPMYF